MSTANLMNVSQAAQVLGVTRRRLRQLLREGRVAGAARPGREWLIPTPINIEEGTRGPGGVSNRHSRPSLPFWEFRNIRRDYPAKRARLTAVWELYVDPMSDDYTPDDIDAQELFLLWAKRVKADYPDGLIPIYWSVHAPQDGIYETMPFQHQFPDIENFLTFFTWPTNPVTRDRLNWLTLPVVDKLWNSRRADKGGFIQEATGWKPSILQPHAYLPALVSAMNLA